MKRLKKEPLKREYYLYQEQIYQVDLISKGTDEISLIKISDGTRFRTRYGNFLVGFIRVLRPGEVATLLGRSSRSLYRYESKGQIEKPKRYKRVGREDVRFYTKQEILSMHQMISEIHQGHPRKDKRIVNNTIIDKQSLLQILNDRYGL